MVDVEETERYTEDEFEDFLNELYDDVEVAGSTFTAGKILRELEPTNFRVMMADQESVYRCRECGVIYDDRDLAEECCLEEVEDDDGEFLEEENN